MNKSYGFRAHSNIHLWIRATFLLFILSTLAACTNSPLASNPLLGRWQMQAIKYEDGTEKILGGSNAIIFESDAVIEEIEGFGKRRYQYKKDGNSLLLISGDQKVEWEIAKQQNKSMEIATPIGLYIVSKN